MLSKVTGAVRGHSAGEPVMGPPGKPHPPDTVPFSFIDHAQQWLEPGCMSRTSRPWEDHRTPNEPLPSGKFAMPTISPCSLMSKAYAPTVPGGIGNSVTVYRGGPDSLSAAAGHEPPNVTVANTTNAKRRRTGRLGIYRLRQGG